MATFGHGIAGYFAWAGTDLSSYLEGVDLKMDRDSGDIKALGTAYIQRVMGIISSTLAQKAMFDATLMGIIKTGLEATSTSAWILGPQTKTAGKYKISGNGWMKGTSISISSGAPVGLNFDIVTDGTISYGTMAGTEP